MQEAQVPVSSCQCLVQRWSRASLQLCVQRMATVLHVLTLFGPDRKNTTYLSGKTMMCEPGEQRMVTGKGLRHKMWPRQMLQQESGLKKRQRLHLCVMERWG